MLNIKKVDSLPAEVQRSDTLLLSTSDGKIRLDDGTNSYPLGGGDSSSSDSPYGNKTPGGIDYLGRYDIPFSRRHPNIDGYTFAGYGYDDPSLTEPSHEVFYNEGMDAGGGSSNSVVKIYTRNYKSEDTPTLIVTFDSDGLYSTSSNLNWYYSINCVYVNVDTIYLLKLSYPGGDGTASNRHTKHWHLAVFQITLTGTATKVYEWNYSNTNMEWQFHMSSQSDKGRFLRFTMVNDLITMVIRPGYDKSSTASSSFSIKMARVDVTNTDSAQIFELSTDNYADFQISLEGVGVGYTSAGFKVDVYPINNYNTDPNYTVNVTGGSSTTSDIKAIGSSLEDWGFLFQNGTDIVTISKPNSNEDATWSVFSGSVSNSVRFFTSKDPFNNTTYLWYSIVVDSETSNNTNEQFEPRSFYVLDLQTGKKLAGGIYNTRFLAAAVAEYKKELYICVDRGDGTEDRYLVNA